MNHSPNRAAEREAANKIIKRIVRKGKNSLSRPEFYKGTPLDKDTEKYCKDHNIRKVAMVGLEGYGKNTMLRVATYTKDRRGERNLAEAVTDLIRETGFSIENLKAATKLVREAKAIHALNKQLEDLNKDTAEASKKIATMMDGVSNQLNAVKNHNRPVTQPIVDAAMKAVSKDVRAPEVVRKGIVVPKFIPKNLQFSTPNLEDKDVKDIYHRTLRVFHDATGGEIFSVHNMDWSQYPDLCNKKLKSLRGMEHVDSLDSIEIIMNLEREFDIAIPDEAAEKLLGDSYGTTFMDVVGYVVAKKFPTK